MFLRNSNNKNNNNSNDNNNNNCIWTFLVRLLGCWRYMYGDEAIPDYHGALGILGCYEKAAALRNTVFSVYNGKYCYTTSTAGNTYRKYGPSTTCTVVIYEIVNGNSVYFSISNPKSI